MKEAHVVTQFRRVESGVQLKFGHSAHRHLLYLQSEEIWPAPPHLVQRVVLVMLRGSEFCQGRRILWIQETISMVSGDFRNGTNPSVISILAHSVL